MLRERVPDFKPAVGPVLAGKVMPRVRKPVAVSFRSGADLSEVVRVIDTSPNVVVEAAPGAGKSTVLPYVLAERTGGLVVHVFPNERLADHVAAYTAGIGHQPVLMLDVADEYPRSGVACIPAAVVVAKWLAAGAVVMPDCYVFHDESHESDAFTYMIKTLVPDVENIKSYISVSATHSAASFRAAELPGRVTSGVYDGAVSTWDPYEQGKPWHIFSLRENAVLMVDSRAAASALVEAYSAAGFMTYRLHSRMTLASFRNAMQAMENPRTPVVVFIADSSHRSGFNFDACDIIDSGKVSYMDTSSGKPIRRERNMYKLEAYQTSCRGAARLGKPMRYWSPRGPEPEPCICDLLPVEAEAVALMMRVLGYVPPREFEHCVMFDGLVPRDLVGALQGDQPLALYRADQLVSLEVSSTPEGRRSPFLADRIVDNGDSPIDVLDPRVSADTARKVGMQRYTVGESATGHVASWQQDLQSMLVPDAGVEELEVGKAYYATGLATDADKSVVVFPNGADSVLRMFDGHGGYGALNGLDPWHRSIAVNLLLSRQGALAAELDGIQRAVGAARNDATVMGTPAARVLATRIAERLAVVTSQSSHAVATLRRLGADFCAYHEMEVNVAHSDSIFDNWMSAWQALPRVHTRATLTSGFSVGREAQVGMRALTSHLRQRSDPSYVPMPFQGKGMRAIKASVSSSSSGSVADDDRCTGSTYSRVVVKRVDGGLAQVRDLVCEICGVGASRKRHRASSLT